jgi:hypothetical protein
LSTATAGASEIEVRCSIFVLLFSMIAIHADNLPVISDSEAFAYSSKCLKVPGLVFAFLISRRGTALDVQESLTLVYRRTIRFLLAALSLILTASHSQAGLGWTLAQFKQQYGKPVLDQEQIAGRIGYVFTGEGYIIAAFLRNTQVSRILYICRGSSVFDWERARALLKANAPDAIWDDAAKDEADNSYRVDGRKDGVESYYASLTDDGKMLALWTKEDDEAGRTKPRLDTPSVSNVVGSNEKSTGEVTAGHVSSTDSESTPEINHPDVPANATSSSPAQPPSTKESETSNPPESQFDRSAESSGEEEFLKEFVLGYLRTVASNDTSLQHRYFAEQVNFYGRGVLNSSIIEASTQRYHNEWPIRKWAARGEAKVVRSSNPNLFVVYQPFNWTVSDGSRNAHGNATLYLRIRKNSQGEFRIVHVYQLDR